MISVGSLKNVKNVNSKERIIITPLKEKITSAAIFISLIVVFITSVNLLNLDFERFISRLENLPNVISNFMSFNISAVPLGIQNLMVSVFLAFCGLVIGAVISFILAFCGASNTTFFKPLAVLIKSFVSLIRAVPNLVLILMIVASIGIGYIAGVIALTLSSIGYLTKAFIASIEEQDKCIEEALRTNGATWFQIIYHGYLPNVWTHFLSWISINLESNISASISLGIVGAGGIGMLINRAIRGSNHADLTTYITIIFIFLYVLEVLITNFKRRIK